MTLGCNVFRHDCKEMFKINYEVNKFNIHFQIQKVCGYRNYC